MLRVTAGGTFRGLNSKYQFKWVWDLAYSQPWPSCLLPVKWNLASLKDEDHSFNQLPLGEDYGVSVLTQFQNSRDSYFMAQMLFFGPFCTCHTPPLNPCSHYQNLSLETKQNKNLPHTSRLPLLLFLIHCGTHCHSNGCPHRHFIIWGFHQVFLFFSFLNSNRQHCY